MTSRPARHSNHFVLRGDQRVHRRPDSSAEQMALKLSGMCSGAMMLLLVAQKAGLPPALVGAAEPEGAPSAGGVG